MTQGILSHYTIEPMQNWKTQCFSFNWVRTC